MRKRLKKIFIILIIFIIPFCSFSQKNEIGFHLGGAYYVGDLNPWKHFAHTRPAGGLTYRHNFTSNIALKTTGTFAMLYADNSKSGFNPYGDISFQSKVIELSPQLEIDFFPFYIGNNDYLATPYVFGGIAAYYQTPELTVNDELYTSPDISDYGSAPQFSASMPFGIGLKSALSKKVCLSFEWGFRKTFSDYTDKMGVLYIETGNSQTNPSPNKITLNNYQVGSEEDDDWYTFASIHLTFIIKNKTKDCKMYDDVK